MMFNLTKVKKIKPEKIIKNVYFEKHIFGVNITYFMYN